MKIILLILIATISNIFAIHNEELYVFGGFDLGFSSTSNEEINNIDTKSGFHGQLRTDLLYNWNNIHFDLGVGYFNSTVSGGIASVNTKSVFFEFSPKYEILSDITLGPIFTYYFSNSKDNGFSELDEPINSEIMLLGLRADFYSMKFLNKFDMRFIGQGSVSIDIKGRNYFLATIGIQIGIPIISSSPSSYNNHYARVDNINHKRTRPKTKIVEKVKYIYVPQYIKTRNNSVKGTLSSDTGLNFRVGQSGVKPKMRRYLNRLAKILKSNKNQYKSVLISGHTDDTGRLSANMKLSLDRARAVKRILLQNGVKSKKIQVLGQGPLKPLVMGKTPRARAQNRRVEIDFFGVDNTGKFIKELSRIKS